jgi:hypothetical protein
MPHVHERLLTLRQGMEAEPMETPVGNSDLIGVPNPASRPINVKRPLTNLMRIFRFTHARPGYEECAKSKT